MISPGSSAVVNMPWKNSAADNVRSPLQLATSFMGFGRYAVTLVNTLVFNEPNRVGDRITATWTLTSNCAAGPCDVSVVSTTGRHFRMTYADGVWTWTQPLANETCIDLSTGKDVPGEHQDAERFTQLHATSWSRGV